MSPATGLYAKELGALRAEMLDAVEAHRAVLEAVHPDRRASARNLIHYLTLRRHDIRALQPGRASMGMSSLGRIESRVLPTIDAVLRRS